MSPAAERSSDRWRQLFAAADRALELSDDERDAYVARLFIDDPALGAELERFLASAGGSSPLDTPAAALMAPLLAKLPGEPRMSVPFALGPYQIVREIGRGGMGAVYLAERADDQYRKRVAVKLLPAWSASDEHRVRRFVEERQILAALEHPAIARLLDGGITADGLPWFAMEYVDGAPIDRYCDDHGLTIERRLELFRRVTEAVAYAHRNLIVHRDLKPGNILVTADGAVKLLDFGIAKLLGGGTDPDVTRTRDRLMTPLYASPEQVSGAAVSTASDVYALGVLLYELLAGRNPYGAPTHETYGVMRAILEREPDRPSSSVARTGSGYDIIEVARARGTTPAKLRHRLEGDLDVIVAKALEKDPARRYATVDQLDADVERHLTGRPIAARAGGSLYRGAKLVRRHKAATVMAAAFALVVVTFTVVTGVQALRIRAEAARVAAERASTEATLDYIAKTFGSAAPSPREGRGLTAREVLDTSAARIETALPGQPAARAQLMAQLGLAYHRLGMDDRAQQMLEASVALQRSLRPGDAAMLAETLDALGTVLLDRGDVAAADRADAEAIGLWRARRRGQAGLARTLNGLAAVRRRQARASEAESLAREALAIDRRRQGDTRADVAQSLRSLGRAIADQGNVASAQPLLSEALALFRQVRSEEDPEVAATVLDLAAVFEHSGDAMRADSLFRYGIALYRRLGPVVARDSLPLRNNPAARVAPSHGVASGSTIVFVSDRDGPDPVGHLGRQELYRMNPDGSNQQRLTNDDVRENAPAVSPDGRRIAFNEELAGGVDIVVMNLDGSGRTRLTNLTAAHLGALRPTWSPDGKKVAFQSYVRPDIYVINVDGTGLVNLTNHPAADIAPSWSPDGRRIAFVSTRDGSPDVYIMNADGTSPTRLTVRVTSESGAGGWLSPVWSPNGRQLAFAANRDGTRAIHVINADGSGLVRLTTGTAEEGHPTWSPDGKQIAFHRRALGHTQIFIMNADGSDQRRVTELSEVAFNGFPSWGRDPRAPRAR